MLPDDRERRVAAAIEFVEHADPGEVAWVVQRIAAYTLRRPELAETSAALYTASQGLHQAERVRYAQECRQYHCMLCHRMRSVAPADDCAMPFEHFNAALERYAPVPPRSPYAASLDFHQRHWGLPWYDGCEPDMSGNPLLPVERGGTNLLRVQFYAPIGRPTEPGDTWEGWSLEWLPVAVRRQ